MQEGGKGRRERRERGTKGGEEGAREKAVSGLLQQHPSTPQRPSRSRRQFSALSPQNHFPKALTPGPTSAPRMPLWLQLVVNQLEAMVKLTNLMSQGDPPNLKRVREAQIQQLLAQVRQEQHGLRLNADGSASAEATGMVGLSSGGSGGDAQTLPQGGEVTNSWGVGSGSVSDSGDGGRGSHSDGLVTGALPLRWSPEYAVEKTGKFDLSLAGIFKVGAFVAAVPDWNERC